MEYVSVFIPVIFGNIQIICKQNNQKLSEFIDRDII